MNYFKLITLPLVLLGIVLCTSCSNDDDYLGTALRFEKKSYEARINETTLIQIMGGSQSYTLIVKDPNILGAGIITYAAKYNPGSLSITGMKKGTTTVTVTDNKRKEQETLSIKIVDFYTTISINESNHPLLKKNRVLFIVNNPAKDFYLFQEDEKTKKISSKPLLKGTYEFNAIEKTPYLTLTYANKEAVSIIHKFDLSESVRPAIIFLNNYFLLGWEEWLNPKNRISQSNDFDVTMTEEGTENKIKGNLHKYLMPDGILD